MVEDGGLPPYGPEDLARDFDVSRETLERLKAYVGLLGDWNSRHNLVSAGSLGDVWRRHILDSAQLVHFVPENARTLADLGSGAGFPGLVLAVLRGELKVTLFEATTKKCRFLEAAAARMELTVAVRNERIEKAQRERFDVVTARACAPLSRLIPYAQHFAGKDTVCLFLKGQNVEAELTKAHNSWRMKVRRHQSVSDPSGTILDVRGLAPNERKARQT
jgi:16S rRNA (guanine527-N7)-methyltransferase